ncbi:ras-domain-containing protein [Hyaloscypha variabilis F]|uniref:Ras-domain-containing protein n=1 Tax=Hyaloscypha variabilis (strain UAMH 11265 / GT02V1 / F) TaxID=1149755 RepID=A0A2J6R709_HYAVF|nr:ras-domain-containing protein [Hyaloscypha variabilis F]
MESQNEQPLSNKTSLPSSATESSGPIRVKFNSRKRSFRILGRTKPGSTVTHPNDAASARKAYGEHDRDHPGQLARQLAGPSRAAEKMVLYKLVVLGDGGVGKTALTIQLTLQHFVVTYDPTIEDSYRKQVVIDGKSCMLEVLDTAGQEEYTALRNQWIRDGEGFLLVYSICERSSFTRVSRFHHQIMSVKGVVGARPPVMLVGHHYHEDEEGNFERHDREVSIQEGQALGKELGCDFVEASAQNCINVEKAFYDVVRALRRQRAPGMPIISG